MSLTLEQLVENLVECGLVSRAKLQSVCEQLSTGGNRPDPQDLVRKLVSDERLTAFQAKVVWAGKAEALVFDEYVILDKIGAGGMGVVFKARHRRMDRIVAAKRLAVAALEADGGVDRFYREVKAAARLSHPNIVTAYDAREYKGVHYLIMEYVDGQDLAHLVKQQGPLPVEQAVDYMVQAARGLQYAHDSGIYHRDIKPANLLVTSKDERPESRIPSRHGAGKPSGDHAGNSPTAHAALVKILDMGLARIKDESTSGDSGPERLTASGQVMGTCDYMAPEQAEDASQADQRCDIYSLGCTLYRLLAGTPPYRGQSLMNVLIAHRETPTPALADHRPDVSQALSDVCRRMMAKRPEDRYQSMGEVIEALGPSPAREPTPPPPPADPDSKLTGFLQQMGPQPAASPTAAPATRTMVAGQPTDGTVAPRQGSTDLTAAMTIGQLPSQGPNAPATMPTAAPHATGTHRRRTPRRRPKNNGTLLMIGMGLTFLLVGAALAALFLHGQPTTGTIVIDPRGEDVKVFVKYTYNAKISPVIDASTDWRLEVEPGTYQLVLEGGDGRLALDMPSIAVQPGDEVRVSVVRREEAVVRREEAERRPAGEETPEHRAARLVIGLGGRVRVSTDRDPDDFEVGVLADLPTEAFRLCSIVLTRSQITDDQLAQLPALPELSQLHINTTSITDDGLAKLPSLPGLKLLQLNGTKVTSDGLVHLRKFPILQSLFLSETSIDDRGVRHLAQLPGREHLRNLELDGTRITDQALALLAAMPNVRNLWVKNTAVSDTGLKYLQRAPVLEFLDVRRTRVTVAGVAEFKRARPRCKVEH